jgi:HEAT repeat protein
MPPTYWCPRCWRELPADAATCPACGYDVEQYSALPYEQKLLLALRHPVMENRMLAVQALGRRREQQAVPALQQLLEGEVDFYLLREVLEALAAIATDESRVVIEQAREHPSPLVRREAQRLLAGTQARTKSEPEGRRTHND